MNQKELAARELKHGELMTIYIRAETNVVEAKKSEKKAYQIVSENEVTIRQLQK